MCTSVTARKYDPLGKAAPLDLRLKNDLRKLILKDPDWDSPISRELRCRWVDNFQILRCGLENWPDMKWHQQHLTLK